METLQISEIFESIQGETSLSGLMTSFVRLAGCPLRCSWCDSSHTFDKGTEYSFEKLFSALEEFGWKYVCITGGEPLLQKPIIPFMEQLLARNYSVSLETSGSLSIEAVPEKVITILDVKCPGSGMSHKNLFENFQHLKTHDEIKFVLASRSDYDWAKEILARYHLFEKNSKILFSPAWGLCSPENLIAWVKEDSLPVRINLQLHKYIWGPSMKGV